MISSIGISERHFCVVTLCRGTGESVEPYRGVIEDILAPHFLLFIVFGILEPDHSARVPEGIWGEIGMNWKRERGILVRRLEAG